MDALLLQRLRKAERDRRDAATVYRYERAYARYQDWLDAEGLNARDVTALKFEEYVDGLLDEYMPSTVRGLLMPVRAAYNYDRAVDPRNACPDPCLTYTLPHVAERRPRVLTIAELRTLRDNVIGERDRLLFYALAFTGMRRDEIRRMEWGHIDFDAGLIDVVGKGGKFRQVPLHPEFRRVLQSVPERERGTYVLYSRKSGTDTTVGNKTINTIVRGWAADAGVENVTCHVFRKTVATTMLQSGARYGVTTPTIDKIMGWAPSSVSERHYYDVPTEAMHTAINVLYPGGL